MRFGRSRNAALLRKLRPLKYIEKIKSAGFSSDAFVHYFPAAISIQYTYSKLMPGKPINMLIQ